MKKLFPYLFILVFFQNIFAGTTGKISGIVVDAQSGEALVGVNIFIEDSPLGAASDVDGYFAIVHVPAGSYTVHASYIGYDEVVIRDVKVEIGLTTTLDIKMNSDLLSTEEVVVVAKRPVVQKDISNSQLSLDAKSIQSVPVTTLNDVLTLQAGIENSSRGLIIRGGGANQTVFMMDGFSTNDERSNYPVTGIPLGNVDEVQVLTGGFSAEYEQARSGVVNTVTKKGKKIFAGYMTFDYRPAGPKNFGNSIYDKDSYFNRAFFDPEVMWTGTNNGAWDQDTKNQNVDFVGWETVANNTLLDQDPDNDLTPEEALRLFEWYRRRDGRIQKGDYRFEAGFGGPVPYLNKYVQDLSFYLSHYQNREMYVFPLSRDSYFENSTRLKFNAHPSSNLQVMFFVDYGEVKGSTANNWTPPTGSVLRGVEEVANLTNGTATGLSIPFMPGYFSPTDIYRGNTGLKLTYLMGAKSYFEFKASYRYNNYKTFQIETRDTTRRYEVFDGYYVDEAPYGYWGYPAAGPGDVHLGGWMNLGRDKSKNSTLQLNADYSNQFNRWNEVKTGISLVYNNYNINSFTENPLFTTWRRTLKYNLYPYRAGFYIQDKMEFSGFIANAGFRLDYYDPNTTVPVTDIYDEAFKAGQADKLDKAPTEPARARLIFSPRLGISHPITESSKLYFNYGHFRSEPFSSFRFRLQQENNGQTTFLGNPNLEPERTIAYEVGFEQSFWDTYLIKIAGYYKDVTNQPGWIAFQGLNNISYRKAASNNYADIRGLEITLRKRYGNWFSGFVNYTYDVRSSGYFGILENYEDPKKQREYNKQHPVISRRLPQPYASANLVFFSPEKFGPAVGDLYPLEQWRLSVLGSWKTGAYETYNPLNEPGIADNTQWEDVYNVDIRLSKEVKISKVTFDFYLDVRNLFNNKYMSRAGFSDIYDWNNYMESLNFSWEEGDQKGNDRVGTYRDWNVPYDPLEANPDNDPAITARNNKRKENKSYIDMPNIRGLTFLNPRNVRFGVTVRF